jgi:hypothetical protein
MCFSATASFGAAAVLGVVGGASLAKADTRPKKTFAAIPLIFAVQQLSEGMLWLSLKNDGLAPWQSLFTYTFLFFAMALWPFWIPFSVWKMEMNTGRKKILRGFVVVGAIVTVGTAIILSIYPVKVVTPFCWSCPISDTGVLRHHLHYDFSIPQMVKNLIMAFTVLYIAATIIAPFISSIRGMKWLGIVFLLSYLFAVIFYNGFVISVWCFFAAVLSFIVWWIILRQRVPARRYSAG